MRSYVTEFIGTFFLVLTIALTVIGNVSMAPLAIGLSLMVMVYMGGHISGGHYNPAVTLAVFLRGKLSAAHVVPYWISQLAGAFVAALTAFYITGKDLTVAPSTTANVASVLLVEILFTFALALVVLQTATAKKTEGNSFYGLAIGMTVAFAAFAGGSISGGAFNPAVGTGPILWEFLNGNGTLDNLWFYLVGPFTGGALAALVFKLQNAGDAR